MKKLVLLKQCFQGKYSFPSRYCYLMENPKLNDLVSDGVSFVGKVIEIREVDDSFEYKNVHEISKETAKILLRRMRYEWLKECHRETINELIKDYDRDFRRGGFEDPNLGWVSFADEDIDFEEMEQDYEPTEKELNNYVEDVLKELK